MPEDNSAATDLGAQAPEPAKKPRRRAVKKTDDAAAEVSAAPAAADSAAPAAAAPDEAPAPKKRARRTSAKKDAEPAGEAAAGAEGAGEGLAAASGEAPEKPRRRATRARRPKADAEPAQGGAPADGSEVAPAAPAAPADGAEAAPAEAAPAEAAPAEAAPAEAVKPKRRPGRPRKAKAIAAASEPTGLLAPAAEPAALPQAAEGAKASDDVPASSAAAAESVPAGVEAAATAEPAPEKPRRRGRPRKNKAADEVTAAADVTAAQSEDGAAEPEARPAGDAPKGAEAQDEGSSSQEGEGEGGRRGRRNRRNKFDRDRAGEGQEAQGQQGEGGRNRNRGDRNDRGDRDYKDRRNNRRNREVATEPSVRREDLEALKVSELRAKADELGVDHKGLLKTALIDKVYEAAVAAEGFRSVEGILEIGNEGYGWIRTGNYMEGDGDCFVHQQMIRGLGLRPGDRVAGTVGPGRSNSKYPPLVKVSSVNGRDPEGLKARPRFRDLTPVYPNERLVMEMGQSSITGRAIDLVSPIGKGQRGLIVSPPKAGKTTVLKKICQSIAHNNPEVHLFCLLVDERPEEVTDMERSIKGEVVASTFDMPADNHTHVSELVIEHAKRLVELGEDVVVVLDSITRLARAYNLAQPASGRILSGGVDSAALYPPKKFLGAARNIENGGSLTIIASALVDTGSKMDEVIFEEFKGTGNMELKLDRELADKRIFPAIDPVSSGTRNEDLLIPAEIAPFVWGVRRVMANMNNVERAANALVKGLKGTHDNQEFLIKSARKAQQTDYIA